MKLSAPPDLRLYHFVGGTINQSAVVQEYAQMTGKLAPCGDTVWADLPGPRGWTFSKGVISTALKRAATARAGLSLSVGFIKTSASKFGDAEDAAVAAGAYDAQLKELAALFVSHTKVPVLLRIGNEVNGSWQGHHPGTFKDAFRRVVMALRTAGVKNVATCCCFEPHGADPFKADGTSDWWPGNDVADWVGLDLFQSNTFAGLVTPGSTLTTAEKRAESVLDFARNNDRPVFLAETALAELDPGTDLATGVAVYNKWFDPWFQMLIRFPVIKGYAIMPVDWSAAGAADFAAWGNARFQDSPYIWGRWMSFLTMKGAGYGAIHLPEFQQLYGL